MKKKGEIPKNWTKEMYDKFERCVKAVKEQNEIYGTDYNPYAVCHASLGYDPSKKKYDLPEPYDIHFNATDVILRLVPEIDNLFEIGIYIDSETFKKIKKKLDEMGIRYEVVEDGYLARRGRHEKATNVFIIES
jgi:hypothetical protein